VPLILAATPIGNPADASERLRDALATADVVAAEDTRRLRRLAAALDVAVAGRVVSFYDAVEQARSEELLTAVRAGQSVLVVTDAGTPVVSDPGYRLVVAAVTEGLSVISLPGPSAVLAAIAVSGLPADRWCFEGFLPRKQGERRRRLAVLAGEQRTLVFFEAPHRLAAMLGDLVALFGSDRRAVVCRELTKTHEEVRRGTLAELATWARSGVRGEITLVVHGAPDEPTQTNAEELAVLVRDRMTSGMSRRDAVDVVAAERGLSRREVYAATVAASASTD
jgi:16S rRNA (cytidine1402-2'-O)-methyltransferase